MSNNQSIPYSYHTFIFPFLFADGSKNISREDFKKCLHKAFVEDKFDHNPNEYARFRYFNQAARNAIYTNSFDESAVVWNYRLDINKIVETPTKDATGNDTKARFVIDRKELKKINDKGEVDTDTPYFHAELEINNIRVKLFETGVGMLIFELENHDHAHSDEKSVTKINEYGRRVFHPFIGEYRNAENPAEKVFDCSLSASSIEIKYNDTVICGGNILGSYSDGSEDIKLSAVIHYLLTGPTHKITTVFDSSKIGESEFRIEPIIDERMFVACVYKSPEFVADLCQWNSDKNNYRYITDALTHSIDKKDNAARRFYEMVFIDGNGLTCQNRAMLYEMNKCHSYARWAEYGTLHGMTEYSIVCMTGDDTDVFNINPFLTEYLEMTIIVLAQRASILAFERAISEISCNHTSVLNVGDIHKEYIKFDSTLLLSEVTSQQQGIELYDMMRERFLINKLTKEINEQIKACYELDTANNEEEENTILFWLAVFGGADVVAAALLAVVSDPLVGILVYIATIAAIALIPPVRKRCIAIFKKIFRR